MTYPGKNTINQSQSLYIHRPLCYFSSSYGLGYCRACV